MKVKVLDVANAETWEDLKRWASQMLKDLGTVINGQVTFGDNIPSTQATVSFGAANTEVRVAHSLARVPNGYIVVSNSAAVSVFNGATANTSSEIYIQASGAATVKVLVF